MLDAVQLGLHVQVGNDVSDVKQDFRALKQDVGTVSHDVRAVRNGIHLCQVTRPIYSLRYGRDRYRCYGVEPVQPLPRHEAFSATLGKLVLLLATTRALYFARGGFGRRLLLSEARAMLGAVDGGLGGGVVGMSNPFTLLRNIFKMVLVYG